MKLSVCIPIFNQLNETRITWGCHLANIVDKDNTELIVLDNGSTDGYGEWLNRFIFPHFPRHNLIRHEDNIGLVNSSNQLIENSSGEIIALLHNDVLVFEKGWDQRVVNAFERHPEVGLAGFLGAKGAALNGGRWDVLSNMLEAEIHGVRESSESYVVLFDGLSLIGRRKMFEQVGGIDQNYTYHHFYDKDVSLTSYYAGWKNLMIGVYHHHMSGITANRPDYQKWISKVLHKKEGKGDQASYDASEKYFLDKWKERLPVKVD
jgi:GT2 family glycosyltransferase